MLKDKEKALVRAFSRVSRHCGILRRFLTGLVTTLQ